MVKNILIIDDLPDDIESMKTILEKEGYTVATAANKEEALRKITKEAFDLILLDLLMPDSGYAVLKILRKKIDHKSKIAYVSIIPKQDVNLAGVDGFIQKPFSNEIFMATVKGLVTKR